MIDINYVQVRLDKESIDMCLPLRSWVRDLITEVRKLEDSAVKTTLAIAAYKEMVNELQDKMTDASEAFDQGLFLTGMELLEIKESDDEEDSA